jgi:glycosyltransferase involved in cell wall biosynthesis
LKRIAIISEDLSLPLDEGFKKASAHIASALIALGKETVVFTRQPERSAVPAQALPPNKLLAGGSFSRKLKAAEPDVVLYVPQAAATPMSLVRARLLRRQAGNRPVVVLSLQRRTYPALFGWFLKALQPQLMLVLSSESVEIAQALGLRARRVPLGVDTDVFRPAGQGEKEDLRKKYGFDQGKLILHVGHLTPGRNLEILKRVVGPGRNLLVVSSTSTTPDPEVKRMLQSPAVVLLDKYVEQIEEIYRLSDGYLFPTFGERHAIEIPLSVLEALSTDLPVITTAFGGLPDLFEQGKGLFMCSSPEELVACVDDMLKLPNVSTRQLVLGLSWKQVAAAMAEAIEEELA